MGILRSEDMYLYKFVVSKDNAWDLFNILGHIECCHLIDMNKTVQSYKLPYIETVKRCEDIERKLL